MVGECGLRLQEHYLVGTKNVQKFYVHMSDFEYGNIILRLKHFFFMIVCSLCLCDLLIFQVSSNSDLNRW